MPRQLLLLCLASLLLLAAVLAYPGGEGTVASTGAGPVEADIAVPVPVPANAQRAPVDHAPLDPRRQAHRATLPGKSSRRAELESAPDLYAYANTLAPAVRAGDPEAAWMLSRVHEYCSAYAMAPADYARDTQAIGEMQLRTSEAMVAARTRTGKRCARFVPRDDLSYTAILVGTTEAAEAGSLAAEAALLAIGEPLETSDAYRHDLVERVQRSGDPESFAALSPAMGIRASGQQAFAGQVAGTQLAEVAWKVAACELGMDCSAGSTLMTSLCANGGICSRNSGQDFRSFVFDAAVPRQGADVVNEMVNSLTGEEKVPK
ncbi:hypothetical protein [Lysobacter sp. A378]